MRNITGSLLKVLEVLARPGEHHATAIARTAHLGKTTVSPILARLENNGRASSRMETCTERGPELRPLRRYYRITRSGRDLLALGLDLDHTRASTPTPRKEAMNAQLTTFTITVMRAIAARPSMYRERIINLFDVPATDADTALAKLADLGWIEYRHHRAKATPTGIAGLEASGHRTDAFTENTNP